MIDYEFGDIELVPFPFTDQLANECDVTEGLHALGIPVELLTSLTEGGHLNVGSCRVSKNNS
jgi:hypothetical protein